ILLSYTMSTTGRLRSKSFGIWWRIIRSSIMILGTTCWTKKDIASQRSESSVSMYRRWTIFWSWLRGFGKAHCQACEEEYGDLSLKLAPKDGRLFMFCKYCFELNQYLRIGVM